jgi:hypothetical protein
MALADLPGETADGQRGHATQVLCVVGNPMKQDGSINHEAAKILMTPADNNT